LEEVVEQNVNEAVEKNQNEPIQQKDLRVE
jgi:hypothetical protein